MGFLDSYKRLERLCGDIYNHEKPISAYIAAMIERPLGSRIIQGWDDDLKKLKRYRRIRNKIVHEPSYTEANMCGECDVEWVENFILRILNQTDPLALYRKATHKSYTKSNQNHAIPAEHFAQPKKQSTGRDNSMFWLIMLLIALIALVAILLYKNL